MKVEKTVLEKRVSRMKDQIKPELSIRENMLNFLMNEKKDMTDEEAKEVVDQILSGIGRFNEVFAACSTDGSEAVMKEMDELLKDKKDEEKYAAYLNATVAIKSLDAKVLKEILHDKDFNEEQMLERLKNGDIECQGPITEIMLEEARQKLHDALESSVITLSDIKTLETIPDDKLEEYVKKFAVERWSYEERKAYLALAAYMAYKDNELEMEEEASDPYFWAVSIAAAVETERTLHDASTGKISWETAKKILKGIGYAALVLGMGLTLGAVTILYLQAVIMASGILSMFATAAVGIWIVGGMIRVAGKPFVWYSEGVDRLTEFLGENSPQMKESIRSAYEFVKEKIASGYVHIRSSVKQAIHRTVKA